MVFRSTIRAVLLIATVLISGCARFPSTHAPTAIREMSFRIDFEGAINDNDFYFVPIDTTGGSPGPVPIFPGIAAGQGWVTGAAAYYVEYHLHQYAVYRITSLQPFISQPVGAPVRFTLPDPGSKTLQFTVDLNAISAIATSVNVNIIATDQPFGSVRLLDALGRTGGDFVNIDIRTNRTFSNSDGLIPEEPGDVLDQNGNIQPANDQTDPLDITNWTITVDVTS